MEQYEVRHSDPALQDLADILRHFLEVKKEPQIAMNLIDTIDEKVGSLSTMPHRCPLVRDEFLAALGYRLLIVGSYNAFFTIDEGRKIVNIERILYARRDWQSIL